MNVFCLAVAASRSFTEKAKIIKFAVWHIKAFIHDNKRVLWMFVLWLIKSLVVRLLITLKRFSRGFRFQISWTKQKTLAVKFHNQVTFSKSENLVLMWKKRDKKYWKICKEIKLFRSRFRSISNCHRFLFKCQEQTLFFSEENWKWQ